MKNIICGGGEILDDKSPFMDLYILAQTKKTLPKVCLLPTASGDNRGLIQFFYELYKRYPCEPHHLSLFNPQTSDIADFIADMDVVLVSGGHSKCMMILWQGYGIDIALKVAYENGTVLAGGSAGSVCWFDQCITDSKPEELSVMDCLGILPFSNCPHFASKSRREVYAHFVNEEQIKPGYAADDYASLHFEDGELLRCVSNRQHSKCYYLGKDQGKFFQRRLRTDFLGEKKYQEQYIWNAPCFEYLKADVEETPIEEDNAANSNSV